jgi:hypothetical protein
MANWAMQLATQFIASYHYVSNHHDYEPLGAGDKIAEKKQGDIPRM